MIQKRHIVPLLAGLMLLAACNKEQEPVLADTDGVPAGHLKLSVENPRPANGSKPLLDGLYTYWKNLDRVYVNGVESRVRIASTETYIENYIPAPAENEYYIAGTFPFFSDQNGTANTSYSIPSNGGKNLFFDCPASYNYSVTSDGKVDLGNIPMVAVAERTASELTFQHLTATINVKITNGINSTFRVTSVEVSASGHQICGRKLVKINPDGELTMNGNTVGTINSNMKKVTVNFPSNTDIAYGQSLSVPVPVTQVNSGRELTIKVTGTYPYGQPLFTVGSSNLSNAPGAGSTATYTRSVTLTNGLARNSYVNANVQLKPSSVDSYFSSNVLNNWVKFCYNNSWLYGNQMCLWSTLVNENRTGSFAFTAAQLEKIMKPEIGGQNSTAAGSLLVWHQGEGRFKLIVFPYGTTLSDFPTEIWSNFNWSGYTIKDYENNGTARGIPCVNGTYNYLGSNSHVSQISLNLNNYPNYVTLNVDRQGSRQEDDASATYGTVSSYTGYYKKRTSTTNYECKYKNMTVRVVEKTVETHATAANGMIPTPSTPLYTQKEVEYSSTFTDNLNPSSQALYGVPIHNN